jgi:2-iminobutanoate/2-iminopropanoate deaminase
MTKEVFRQPPQVPLSPAVRAGDFVYVSGQVPTDAEGRVVQGTWPSRPTR